MGFLLQHGVFCLLFSLKVAFACIDDNCRILAFPAPFFFDHKHLVNHTIRTERDVDFETCKLLCYQENNCVSINYDLNTLERCELNNATHRGHDNEFKCKENSFYHGADSACDEFQCKNHGTCQSGFTDKRYRCLCVPGFTGERCEKDINECKENTYKCDKNAKCKNNQGSYTCICKPGYFGDGQTCSDIDECQKESNNCSANAVCSNTNGSYICTCQPGYTGNGRNCTGPVAFFPLNITYTTKEINNRTAHGISYDVSLTPGPDGKANGSYEFKGTSNSYIEFPNSAGGALDVRDSMTILCWLLYNGKDGTIFKYEKTSGNGLSMSVKKGKLYLRLYYYHSDVSTRSTIRTTLGGGWKLIGASYDGNSSEAKLWVDGEVVGSKKRSARQTLATQYNIRMGVNIKARITQMKVYNEALTKKQIQAIRNRTRRAEIPSNSTILSRNASYADQLKRFLQPAVGNHSRWLLCYRASMHGWDVRFFHNLCDGKKNTVTIIKTNQYVFGGYTDTFWDSSGGYVYSSKAFIFSLRDKEGLAPFKSLVEITSQAILRHSSYGPTFGRWFDICIANHANTNKESSTYFGDSYYLPSGVKDRFTILAGTQWFTPDEVEVFYLDPSH